MMAATPLRLAHSNGPIEDDEIKRVAQLDRARALGLVARKYRQRLFYHAFSIVKNRQEAHDAIQEVLIKAMREPRFFQAEFGMKPWLFRVTSNLCFNIVRDKRRRAGILDGMPEEAAPQGRCKSSNETVYTSQIRTSIMTALAQLTPNHREILMLRYFGDLSYTEIAAELDVKLGTVMSRLSRARASLSQVVGPNHPLAREAV